MQGNELRYASYITSSQGGKQTLESETPNAKRFMVLPKIQYVIPGITSINIDTAKINEKIEDSNKDDNTFNFSIDNGSYIQDLREYENSREQANELIVEILGEGIFQKFGGFEFAKLPEDINGKQIHGMINRKGKMSLNMLEEGSVDLFTAYHEISHFIDFFLMDDNERAEIYDEIRNKISTKDNVADDLEVSEYFADMKAAWMVRRKRLPNWSRKMFHALDWAVYLCSFIVIH